LWFEQPSDGSVKALILYHRLLSNTSER